MLVVRASEGVSGGCCGILLMERLTLVMRESASVSVMVLFEVLLDAIVVFGEEGLYILILTFVEVMNVAN